MEETRRRKPHAIMISIPNQGHINPLVSLALKLASKGFAITFVHFEFIHHRLSKARYSNSSEVDFFTKARLSGLDIRYATVSDGLPLEFDRDLHFKEYWEIMFRDFPGRADDFVGKMIESCDPCLVHFLIADTLCLWTGAIADKYKLVHVSLWTQPALVFSLLYHLDLLRENGHFPCKDDNEEEINYVPGVESINTKDLMPYLKESGVASLKIAGDIVSASFQQVKKADFILHNTVQELESETISVLNKFQPNYAIGPVSFSRILAEHTVSQSFWSETDCEPWLESKPPASVLYVSFGSFIQTNKQLMEEIAYGLLLSEVHFIWVIRAGILSSGDTDVLPTGYVDKVKDKGLIVSWCDQIKVLSHPAVGGFLTHSGWNSTVESMWCGVPMISYPFAFDQPINRKLVVDDWKIGVNFCDGESVDRNEVAEKIKSFMSGDAAKSLRQEAEKVKGTLRKALQADGSSERNFEQFVKELEAKIFVKEWN